MHEVKRLLSAFWSDEDGPTAVEYALVVTLIAIAIILGATALGTAVNQNFNNTSKQIK